MTKEQYDIISNALDWVACLDGRYVGIMEVAREAARAAMNELRDQESWADEDE